MKSRWSWAPILLGAAVSFAAEKPADADLSTWVAKRVEERQPSEADRRFDEIGWAKDIRTAQTLAGKHRRPVFLFTHDGRMNVGRC